MGYSEVANNSQQPPGTLQPPPPPQSPRPASPFVPGNGLPPPPTQSSRPASPFVPGTGLPPPPQSPGNGLPPPPPQSPRPASPFVPGTGLPPPPQSPRPASPFVPGTGLLSLGPFQQAINFTDGVAGPKEESSKAYAAISAQNNATSTLTSGILASHASAASGSITSTASNLNQAVASISNATTSTSGTLGSLAMHVLSGSATTSVLSSNPSISNAATGHFPRPVVRPMGSVPSLTSNPAVQPPVYPPYVTLPSAGASPQPHWIPSPQMAGLRPPFLVYPPVYPGSYGLPARGMSLPSVPVPDAQPPGVTPVRNPGGLHPSSVTFPGTQMAHAAPIQPEVWPPGTDNSKQLSNDDTKSDAVQNDQSDVWSAHRTESGSVYYYNAITGESTYEKPSGFKGEPSNATAQPTPVAWEKVAGTDWALVTTNDGKKYYYNTETKISSWHIPHEVTELRKKQDNDNLKDNSMSMPISDAFDGKVSGPPSLCAPALNTGGRDAIAFRAPVALGSSSALDMIKKKLQESGTQVASFAAPTLSASAIVEIDGSKIVEAKVLQSDGYKEKQKEGDGDGNASDLSSDSEDEDSGPSKEELNKQFKEMLKERGVAPFSKWDKELPKIVFDPRFKAIPTYAERRSLFEHFVRTRAEEERKEKRAAQKAAVEGFKQLLDEAKEDIFQDTSYHEFRKKWGHDPRFEALERKEREALLNERVLALKKAVEEKNQAERAAVVSDFKSLLRERGDITSSSPWSKVRDAIRDDSRYRAVKHEEREALFSDYILELKAAEDHAARTEKAKRDEEEKIRERERELRKRKERDEQEMERVRLKIRRKEAVTLYQALLVETIKDPQASWTESKPKLQKDPQGRASNPDLDDSDLEKLFRDHVKMLYERCAQDFRALLVEVITPESAMKESEDGKTALTSWSTAKRLLKFDARYTKMPRKDRDVLWKRHAEELQRKQRVAVEQKSDKHKESKSKGSNDSGRLSATSRGTQDRR